MVWIYSPPLKPCRKSGGDGRSSRHLNRTFTVREVCGFSTRMILISYKAKKIKYFCLKHLMVGSFTVFQKGHSGAEQQIFHQGNCSASNVEVWGEFWFLPVLNNRKTSIVIFNLSVTLLSSTLKQMNCPLYFFNMHQKFVSINFYWSLRKIIYMCIIFFIWKKKKSFFLIKRERKY